ncbi:MAG: hypothetical protein ACW9W4_10310 [Candidatus Nitrosopumilus sp. bin_7KS]
MKYFVIFILLIGFLIPSVAFAQYLGGVEFYHLSLTIESKQYSVLSQSNTNHFTDVTYDNKANSLIFSTSTSEDFIDTYTITLNEQTFSELLATNYAKTPESMLVLINGVEQPYQIFKDSDIISWRFYAPIPSDEVELLPSTPRFGTGTYKFDKIPDGFPKIYPPLKQNHLGIITENIQCKDELVLLQKYDGSPACVKPNSVIDLIKRNWLLTEDVGGYAIDYDGDVKHLPFADVCTNEMKIILLTHSNIASSEEEFVIDNVELPFGMNSEDFERCTLETSFTKSRWNMVTMENPEKEIIKKAKELGINNIMQAVDSEELSYDEKKEYIKIRYEESSNKIPSLNIRIKDFDRHLEFGERPTFTVIETGYASTCTSPKLEVYYLKNETGYDLKTDELIYENKIVYPCPEPTSSYFPILKFWDDADFEPFPACDKTGRYLVVGDSGYERMSLEEYYCGMENEN